MHKYNVNKLSKSGHSGGVSGKDEKFICCSRGLLFKPVFALCSVIKKVLIIFGFIIEISKGFAAITAPLWHKISLCNNSLLIVYHSINQS